MNTQDIPARKRAGHASGQEGYTFVEVLIVVAVIAALSIGAFALFTGRGRTTEMTAVAQQVGQTIQSQQQLIYRGLRTGKISSAEIAGSLNSLLSEHRFVIAVTSNQNACASPSGTKSGLLFELEPGEFDSTAAAGELQSIIHASIVNAFTDETGSPFTDRRSFHDVIEISNPGGTNSASAYVGSSEAASYSVGPPPDATVNICLDNT